MNERKINNNKKNLNVIKSLTKCAIKCRLRRIICKKCHIHIHICIKYKAASMQKPLHLYIYINLKRCSQSVFVCLILPTH